MPEKKRTNAAQNNPGPGGEAGAIEKPKDLSKAIKQLFAYLGKYKNMVILASVLAIAGAVLNLIGPNKLSEITNLITVGLSGTMDVNAIARIGTILAVLYLLGFIFNYLQGYIMASVTQYITRNMRHDISVKINRLPLRYFDSTSTGDILSRVTNDVDTVSQSMNQSVSSLVSSVAMLLGSVLMMFLTNWIMAVAGVAAALIGFAIMLKVIAKSQVYYNDQQTELGSLNGQVEETFSGHTVIKTFNGEDIEKASFKKKNDRLFICASKSQFLSSLMMPLMIFIGNLAYVVVCVIGAVLALNGSITFGTIVAFMLYIRLFTQPLQNISQAMSSVQSMAAACERVFEFLDEEEMEDESFKTAKLDKIEGKVDFEHVKFGYDEDTMIIHDFSEHVKPGQKIAIVEPTGAGKTTLVNLLMRFYEIHSGTIQIDGTNTKDLKRENVHDLFGMVLQDTWMFEGTFRENLVYNKTNITQEMLDECCEICGLTDFVKQLPNGYDTVLTENATISAGQRQLITIARAMLANSPLLILDEATSSVDTRTELKVQKAMDMLTQGRTSFVIAHRLSTIRNADCILVLNNGDIIESGTHEQLIAKNGFYADLYNSQFEQAEA